MWPGSTSFLQLDIHMGRVIGRFMQLWIRPRHLDLGLAALSLEMNHGIKLCFHLILFEL